MLPRNPRACLQSFRTFRPAPGASPTRPIRPFGHNTRPFFTSTLLRKEPCHHHTPDECSWDHKQAVHRREMPGLTELAFWKSPSAWRRASVNTFRCLVGCTSGDFTALWFLQAYYPDLGMGTIMAVSMASGLSTSMLLETVMLRLSRDKLSWAMAARTAVGMSFISMLSMELAQNLVDLHLTGGQIMLDSPAFWAAAVVSMGAGFLTPLPYNYIRLRRYGKACH